MEPDLTIESFRAQEAALSVYSQQKWTTRAKLSIPNRQISHCKSRELTCLHFQRQSDGLSNSITHCRSFDVVRVQKASLREALRTYKETLGYRDSKEARATLKFLEGCEDFTTLCQRLMDARQQWSEKKRFFGGKAQDFFHKLCRTMGGHQTILNAFPESNEYMSIFCAAFNTIVQVRSSRHHIRVGEEPLAIYSSSGIVEPSEILGATAAPPRTDQ